MVFFSVYMYIKMYPHCYGTFVDGLDTVDYQVYPIFDTPHFCVLSTVLELTPLVRLGRYGFSNLITRIEAGVFDNLPNVLFL